jgi:hypothetical protein
MQVTKSGAGLTSNPGRKCPSRKPAAHSVTDANWGEAVDARLTNVIAIPALLVKVGTGISKAKEEHPIASTRQIMRRRNGPLLSALPFRPCSVTPAVGSQSLQNARAVHQRDGHPSASKTATGSR